jgi:cell division protein ZapA
VKGGTDEEYVRILAAHVDSVMRDIADKTGSLSSGRVAILAALNIADEMYKERQRFRELADGLAQELEEALHTS